MERSQQLLDAYNRIWKDIQEGRITSVDDVLSSSDGVSAIGTDPTEWWMGGRESLAPILDAIFAGFRQLGATFDTSKAEAWTEGDFGFVVDQQTVTLQDGKSFQWRLTTILRKEGGNWKLVHQHWSVGVPNDQVEAFREVVEVMAQA
jgi:ketosteroid isomerase-like protein